MRTLKLCCVAAITSSLLLVAVCFGGPPRRADRSLKHCETESVAETIVQIELPAQPMRVSPLLGQMKPNRVLIITPLDRQDRLKEQLILLRNLAAQLRQQAGLDVIESPRHVCEATFPIRTGQFDERLLVELGKKYRVDTVLYCNIESIDAYCPMSLQIQYMAVNVDQSVAVVSGSQRFDLSDPNTLQYFYQSVVADPINDTTLKNSPSRLIEFSASYLAGDLTRVWK